MLSCIIGWMEFWERCFLLTGRIMIIHERSPMFSVKNECADKELRAAFGD